MFETKDGLYFQREEDGSVTITKTMDGREPSDSGVNVEFSQTINDGVWASLVCTMSVGGEHNLRWYIAMDFHNTNRANGYDDPYYNGTLGVPTIPSPRPAVIAATH